MQREDFVKVAEETLDLLPEEFRCRIQNVAILVEDFPPHQSTPRTAKAIAARDFPRRSRHQEEHL